MTKAEKVDLAIKVAFISFWVFIAGMVATNDQFQRALLGPLGLG